MRLILYINSWTVPIKTDKESILRGMWEFDEEERNETTWILDRKSHEVFTDEYTDLFTL